MRKFNYNVLISDDASKDETVSFINKIQGKNGVWFAGAWLGNGFHEDGFESAINISKKFNSLPEWLK